jgi:DNA-binding transcriptional LysR family regulator
MDESIEGAEIVLRSNDITVQAKAASVGLGISELACIFGDTQPDLVRVWPREGPTLRPIWVVIHEDLRRAPKIRLVPSAIAEACRGSFKLLRNRHQRRPRK